MGLRELGGQSALCAQERQESGDTLWMILAHVGGMQGHPSGRPWKLKLIHITCMLLDPVFIISDTVTLDKNSPRHRSHQRIPRKVAVACVPPRSEKQERLLPLCPWKPTGPKGVSGSSGSTWGGGQEIRA